MKAPFRLICTVRAAFFLSLASNILAAELPQSSLEFSREVKDQLNNTTTISILSIPVSEQPIENSIRPSTRLNLPVYLQGSAEELNSSTQDFSILTLESRFLIDSELVNFRNTILSEDPDVICLQEISSSDHAFDLYDILEKHYAHFIYIPAATTLDPSESSCENGLLIASKFHIEQPQFNLFFENDEDINEGFFDFIVKNEEAILGHIYAANTKIDSSEAAVTHKFIQIIKKMNADLLKNEDSSLPFILCGKLNSLIGSKYSQKILKTLNTHDKESILNCTLLMLSPRNHLTKNNPKTKISTTLLEMPNKCTALHSIIKRANIQPISQNAGSPVYSQQTLAAQKVDALIRNPFAWLPVLSRRSNNDNNGASGSIEAEFTISYGGSDGPNYEASIKGEVRDGKGNYVSGSSEYDFNTGEGRTSIRGGTICEKD
ncbi:MAG: endonuclease/exonuclease/phosphatase family protein [Rhabdochlamydiaceae bacterium]|nr:endonuclease/exonuclease/phosphatase family protein [Rhabdochlamydiaceae bacterium]